MVSAAVAGNHVIQLPRADYIAPKREKSKTETNMKLKKSEERGETSNAAMERQLLEVEPTGLDFSRICEDEEELPELEPVED